MGCSAVQIAGQYDDTAQQKIQEFTAQTVSEQAQIAKVLRRQNSRSYVWHPQCSLASLAVSSPVPRTTYNMSSDTQHDTCACAPWHPCNEWLACSCDRTAS